MDIKPSEAVLGQVKAHEEKIAASVVQNETKLIEELSREAHIERNGGKVLKSAGATIISKCKKQFLNPGFSIDLKLREGERCIDVVSYTEWITLPHIEADENGLSPQFRYVKTNAVKGPLGHHSTREINEIQVSWVKDEFVSNFERVMSFDESFETLTLFESGVKYDLGGQLTDDQLALCTDVISSLVVPFAEKLAALDLK